MYLRMEQLAMFMNIYKSWLLCSCNDSLLHVTVYCMTLRHQSAWTKMCSEKETTKRKRPGNNKTDVHGDFSLTNVQKGQQVKIHTGEVQQVRPPCSHLLLLTLDVYKHDV